MEDFKEQVKKSFNACKTDIADLKSENEQLKDKLFLINKENKKLKENYDSVNTELAELKAEIKGLNIAINFIKEFSQSQLNVQKDNHKTQTSVSSKIREEIKLEAKPSLSEMYAAETTEFSDYKQEYEHEIQHNHNSRNDIKYDELRIDKKKQQREYYKAPSQDPYEALLAFKAKANKREILKQKLITMIGDTGINLSELKFMFVRHFKYCSNATFYNYLKELEMENTVIIKREKTKNYIYISSIRNEHQI